MLNKLGDLFSRSNGKRKILLYRNYDGGESDLIGSLIFEFLELNICRRISYDPPYHLPKEKWPSWLSSGGIYNGLISDQSPEQIEWLIKNSSSLISVWIWSPIGDRWAELSLDDGNSVSIEVRLDTIDIVTQMSAYIQLEGRSEWSSRLT